MPGRRRTGRECRTFGSLQRVPHHEVALLLQKMLPVLLLAANLALGQINHFGRLIDRFL